MKPDWGALNTRARGLATRLLREADLRRFADLADPAALLAELERRTDGPVAAADAPAVAIELTARRVLEGRLRTLARWCGGAPAPLAVLFEQDDRENIRALVRGALQGADAPMRLAGLAATPALPARALETLARLGAVAPMRVLLSAWAHPYAADLALAEGPSPDLRRFEHALAARWADRSTAAVRRGGRRLRALVAETIDLENVLIVSAVLHAEDESDPVLLAGGHRLTEAVARDALTGRDPARAARVLGAAFVGRRYAAVLRTALRTPGSVEHTLREARLHALAAESRADPLGPAPFFLCLLRFRREAEHLRRLAWGLALGWRGAQLAGLTPDAA